MPRKFSRDFIINESNQCVSCGLCLPYCPTYRLLRSEADSPRGRIVLMNGVANGRLPLNAKFIQHMDRCLTCRACESVCPNSVSYGHLIDETRALIADQSIPFGTNQKPRIRILLEQLFLTRPIRLDRLRQLFYFMQKSGFFHWLLQLNWVERNKLLKFVGQLPLVKFPCTTAVDKKQGIRSTWKEIYPAIGKKRGAVGLFLGCVARIADVATLNSSIYVLNRLGYTVYVPLNQTCCGAIYQHSGALTQATVLAHQNKLCFDELGVNTIISTASGCSVQLIESGVGSNHKQSAELGNTENTCVLSNITDISQFLATAEGWEDVEIAPLSQKVLVHDPCSMRNVLCNPTYPYELMARIPDVQVMPLAGNDQCCGAAGTYFIDQPEIASLLLDDKIAALIDSDVRYLVTSNIGCSMHIANALYERRISMEVLHPVTLLARQMGLEL